MDSVVMNPQIKKDLTHDINTFIADDLWYFDRGIPYKMGILLSGKPGTGKTSLIRALATMTKFNLHYLNLSSEKLDDNTLMGLMVSMNGDNCILVLEDFDTVFDGRKNISNSKVTFSGVLNCLDGIFTKRGMITIITTNNYDTLDSALTRKGRMDKHIIMEYPEIHQIKTYVKLFYDVNSNIELDGMSKLSMSEIQEICIVNKNNPAKADKQLIKELS